jgi:ribose 1,5-bisphosphokinase PhnN
MHALLLQSLSDVRRRLDEQFADSLTSREILRSTRLPSQGREPLREIIARVERTYFGEYAAGPQDYVACRERFTELARALHAASPA